MFTKTAIENMEKLLIKGGLRTAKKAFDGLDPWQHEFVDHVIGHPRTTLLAARRTGKTFALAFLTCIALLNGYECALALNSQEATEGVILDEIMAMLDILEKEAAPWFTPIRKKSRDKTFSSGGRLLLLSTKKKNDGYGPAFVVIDESQYLDAEDPLVLPVFEPFVSPYIANGRGHIVLTGRGGARKSLIHQASIRDILPFKEAVFSDIYLGQKYPELQPEFDEARGMPLYESMYTCKPVPDKGNYIFTNIASDTTNLPPMKSWQIVNNRRFGIDVGGGKGRDATVCLVLDQYDTHYVVKGYMSTQYGDTHEQAALIHEFIERYQRRAGCILIESNYNHGLFHELKRNYCRDIEDCFLHDEKTETVKKLILLNNQKRLVIPDKQVRDELESLTFSVRANSTNWDFTDAHSDIFSALIMAFTKTPEMMTSM